MEAAQHKTSWPFSALFLLGVRARDHKLFAVLMCIPGMLKSLFRKFVSGEMISFAVSSGGGAVGVRRKVMKLCSSIVRTLWHLVLPVSLDAFMDVTGWITKRVALAPAQSRCSFVQRTGSNDYLLRTGSP
jgi:hypothetical protein